MSAQKTHFLCPAPSLGAFPNLVSDLLSAKAVSLLLLVISILSVNLSAAASPDEIRLPKSRVRVDIVPGAPARSYAPTHGPSAKFIIFNEGSKKRSVKVSIDGSIRAERTVLVGAGERRQIFIAAPSNLSATHKFEAIVLETGEKEHTGSSYGSSDAYSLGRLGPLDFALNAEKPWNDFGSLESVVTDDWRSLSGYRAIVVPRSVLSETWKYRQVVLDWIVQGGVLLVAEESVERTGAPPTPIFPRAPLAEPLDEPLEGAFSRRIGLGLVAFIPVDEFALMDENFEERNKLLLDLSWAIAPGSLENDLKYQLKKMFGPDFVHVHWQLFVLLLLFSVLVGPVGWRVLVRKKRRPFVYLLLVMSCSALFSLSIFLADIFAQGINLKGSSQSVTFLDQRVDRELSLNEAAVWAPTSLNTSLTMRSDTATLIANSDSRNKISSATQTVRGESQFIENALSVREQTLVATRRIGEALGRLSVTQTNAELRIENHLGRGLHDVRLWYSGKLYQIPSLTKGETAVLRPTLSGSFPHAPSLQGLLVPKASHLLGQLAAGKLGTDRFIARADNGLLTLQLSNQNFQTLRESTHIIGGLL